VLTDIGHFRQVPHTSSPNLSNLTWSNSGKMERLNKNRVCVCVRVYVCVRWIEQYKHIDNSTLCTVVLS